MGIKTVDAFIVSQMTDVSPEEIQRQVSVFEKLSAELPELEKKTEKARKEYQDIAEPLRVAKGTLDSYTEITEEKKRSINSLSTREEGLTKLVAFLSLELDKGKRELEATQEKIASLERNALANDKKRKEELVKREKEVEAREVESSTWIRNEEERIKTEQSARERVIDEKLRLISQKESTITKALHKNLILESANKDALETIEMKRKELLDIETRTKEMVERARGYATT